MATQKEMAVKLIREIFEPINRTLKPNQRKLSQIIDMAQNQKKYGGQADGSMTTGEWLKYRNICDSLFSLIRDIEDSPEQHLQEHLDEQKKGKFDDQPF